MTTKFGLVSGIVAIAALMGLAGCAAPRSDGPPEEYAFTIRTGDGCTDASGICIDPREAKDGLQPGGNAWLSIRRAAGPVDVVWESQTAFSLSFQSLSPGGKAGTGRKIGNEPDTWTTAMKGAAGEPWRFTVRLARGAGNETVATKYSVRHGKDELDPIVIVDR